jgi:protease-4
VKKLLLALALLFILLVAVSALVATLTMGDGVSLGDKIGLVTVAGPIIDARDAVDEIRKYADDGSIKAIVLRVESPGGAVGPSQEIYREVARAAARKSVVASMGAIAASGGYYISSPATRIVANPGTLTGSIGVIMEIPNVAGLMDKVGLKTTVIKSGRHKDMASMFREIGAEERAILQNVLDDVHAQFIEDVAKARKMDIEKVRALADGSIFTGRQALGNGLVDELGGLRDAEDIAARLAGIEGEPVIVKKKKKSALAELLTGSFAGRLPDISPSMQLKYMLSP